MYSVFSGKNRALKKQLEEYHIQYNTLERRVKGLERDVKSLKDELKDLDECVDRETFYFTEACQITDKSISYIINSCSNLRKLDIAFSREDVKDASTLMRRFFNIEYLDFSGVMALWDNILIIVIIKNL
ncbi:115_t:CDS:2 [Funneliformis geosporum]|nr:115_t:CDS:2 [Funneliformis geosporum]